MKRFNRVLAATALLTVLFSTSCKENEEKVESEVVSEVEDISLNTLGKQVSYLLGYSSAKQLSEAELELDKTILIKAIEDAQSGSESLISDDEVRKVSAEFQRLIQEKRLSRARQENERLGLEYRNLNGKKKGVTETASGIQYEVLASAIEDGKKPGQEDMVKVHYHGTTIDGKVFDSSLNKGSPVTFAVNQVVPGWTEVLQLMSEGDKWRVVIPSELAYPDGTRTIPPGSTLLFDIELLEVNPS